jgi:predicted  nucleic acid-binding Zn-ribbon protein
LAELERLVELQRIDAEIAALEAAAAAVPDQIMAGEERFRQAKAALDAVTVDVDRLQKLHRQKERELDDVTVQLKKRQGRLLEIKTNQEYTAVLKEIDGLKDRISALEEEILLLFDQIEAAAQALTGERQRFQFIEQRVQRERQEKEVQLRDLQERLATLRGVRADRSKGLEAGLLQQYLRLLRSRAGLAVAPARDGSCEGCHVALTPQLYNDVRRNQEILTCERCGRILYWSGERGA